MQTYREIREHVEDWVEIDNAPLVIRRTVNQVLRQITAGRNFDALQESATLTPVNGIITTPPLCHRILRVVATGDDPESTRYFGAASTQIARGVYRIFDRLVPVAASTVRSLRSGAFTFDDDNPDTLETTETLTDAMVGQLLRIEGVSEFYEVEAVATGVSVTIRPEYTGLLTSGNFSVGMYGQSRFALYDRNGDIATGEVRVEYQRYHPALMDNEDILLIPVPSTLALQTVARLLQYAKYAVDAERLQREIMEATAAEMTQQVINQTVQDTRPSTFAGRGRTKWQRGL